MILWQFVRPYRGTGISPSEGVSEAQLIEALQSLAASPHGPWLIVLPGQLVLVLVAGVLAFLSREAFVDRLALRRPQVPLSAIVLVCLGAIGVQLGMRYLAPQFGSTSQELEYLSGLIGGAERSHSVLVLFLLALVPAFCQELFFRGLVQSRLVAVWPAGAAVLLCSTVWSLMHVDANQVLAALPVGVYLGLVAWKSASTWVSMLTAFASYSSLLFLSPRLVEAGIWGYLALALLLGAGCMGLIALTRAQLAQPASDRVLETLK